MSETGGTANLTTTCTPVAEERRRQFVEGRMTTQRAADNESCKRPRDSTDRASLTRSRSSSVSALRSRSHADMRAASQTDSQAMRSRAARCRSACEALVAAGEHAAAWLSARARRRARRARPPATHPARRPRRRVEAQATRLQERLAQAPAPRPSAQPVLVRRRAPTPADGVRAGRRGRRGCAPSPPPLPASTLMGIAEKKPAEAAPHRRHRRRGRHVVYGERGQTVADRYQVTAIGADAVELKDLDRPAPVALR